MEDAPDAGGTASDDVGIEHHEGEAAIAFEKIVVGEVDDAEFFVVGEPVVAWDPGIVLVDFALALFPVVELGSAQADPAEEAADGDVGLVSSGVDEIDEVVAGVMRHPALGQSSPRFV